MANPPKRIAVTGAAGQIGYSLLFRLANGDMLGKNQPVILQLLDISAALPAVRGVVMELEDCAFPLLAGVVVTDDPKVAFRDADYALLVGARPRSKGMERKDLLEANGAIFTVQGRALDECASRDVRVLVVRATDVPTTARSRNSPRARASQSNQSRNSPCGATIAPLCIPTIGLPPSAGNR